MMNLGKFSAQLSPRSRWRHIHLARYPTYWPVKWTANIFCVQVWLYRIVPEVRASMDPE